MRLMIFCLTAIIFGPKVIGQNAFIRNDYRISFPGSSARDSSRVFLGTSYFDKAGQLKKRFEYGPKGKKSWIFWKYDSHGNEISRISKGFGKGADEDVIHRFDYSLKEELVKEVYVRYLPFYESTVTNFYNDSIVERQFQTKAEASNNTPAFKDISFLDRNGRVRQFFRISGKGDTLMPCYYLLAALKDTLAARSSPDKLVSSSFDSFNLEVSFTDSLGKIRFVYDYKDNKFQGFYKLDFDSAGRKASEEFHPDFGLEWTGSVKFAYDEKGIMTVKDENLRDDDLRHVTYYVQKRPMREEFYISDKIDHVLVYEYR